jgi:hypothetical protein
MLGARDSALVAIVIAALAAGLAAPGIVAAVGEPLDGRARGGGAAASATNRERCARYRLWPSVDHACDVAGRGARRFRSGRRAAQSALRLYPQRRLPCWM